MNNRFKKHQSCMINYNRFTRHWIYEVIVDLHGYYQNSIASASLLGQIETIIASISHDCSKKFNDLLWNIEILSLKSETRQGWPLTPILVTRYTSGSIPYSRAIWRNNVKANFIFHHLHGMVLFIQNVCKWKLLSHVRLFVTPWT